MNPLEIIPGNAKWFFFLAVVAFYGIGWVAWRVQNDCVSRGYGPVATSFWSVGTLFLFFPIFPLYLIIRDRMGIKPGAPAAQVEGAEDSTVPQILCPTCGTHNPAYLTECTNCGKSLVLEERAVGVGTISCMVCGSANPIGVKSCQVCQQLL